LHARKIDPDRLAILWIEFLKPLADRLMACLGAVEEYGQTAALLLVGHSPILLLRQGRVPSSIETAAGARPPRTVDGSTEWIQHRV
jgi:hypothetical protein